MIIAAAEFSPKNDCSFYTVEVFFFYILFDRILKAFSKFEIASNSLLIMLSRKAP
jgi:hypothetical protein